MSDHRTDRANKKFLTLSWKIRCKKDRKTKYKQEIANEWKQEIRSEFNNKTRFIDNVINFVFKELEWYVELESQFFRSSKFTVGLNEYFSIVDNVIDGDLKQDFKAGVDKLVESFGEDFDYRTGTDDTVVDLVDPGLFPLQYGKIPIVNENNIVSHFEFAEKIAFPKEYVLQWGHSHYFQYLPSLLKINDNGKFSFCSYINNLHPIKHKDLCNSIENVFNEIIPGLNYTLTQYSTKVHLRIDITPSWDAYDQEYDDRWEELHEMQFHGVNQAVRSRVWTELFDSVQNHLVGIKPEWKQPPKFNEIIDIKSFKELKIIVKLSNIELTPEKPLFENDPYHIQGSINDDIIASILYCYDMENISETKFSFRTRMGEPKFEDLDIPYTKYFYGIGEGDIAVKNMGTVGIREDRILIFPNFYQVVVQVTFASTFVFQFSVIFCLVYISIVQTTLRKLLKT